MLAVPGYGAGTTLHGERFEPWFQQQGISLELKGAGTLRFMKLFKVYVGALYAPEDLKSQQILDDVPKRLEVAYLRPVKAEDIVTATHRLMAEQLDPQTYQRLQARIDQHNALYVDAGPGDRYQLTYVPGRGTELSLNGRVRGVIAGSDFAAALFGMWLGPQPMDPEFKQALLGQG
jgi:hypothetical protein